MPKNMNALRLTGQRQVPSEILRFRPIGRRCKSFFAGDVAIPALGREPTAGSGDGNHRTETPFRSKILRNVAPQADITFVGVVRIQRVLEA
jgi:hypothetical protein